MRKKVIINIVLLSPEIPQNTGAIGRLCVCLDARLILIKPLGFELTQKYLKRAGLDYWQYLDKEIYDSWDHFVDSEKPEQLFFASTKGCKSYFDFVFEPNTYLIFGNESSGLPSKFYEVYKSNLHMIPMPGKYSRSHNLANAVSIVAYEAYRQLV